MTSERRHWAAAVLLLALGLAMRTFGAWVYEFAHTSDHGIICLMVKHMLEGKEFPVFFYGLPYMGSIEPAVSAGLAWLFGQTGFWINMGTALTAFAFLPLIYAWGRGAAGRVAGLAALAFCVIGPPQYFQFESWADGGYAAIPLLTCALLVYGLRLLSRDARGAPPGFLEYLCLGVVAGLGWWQSPLLIPAFLVCGLLFLAALRLRLFTFRLAAGVIGFIVGSLPLWIWNVRNHWQTFDMVKTHDRPSLVDGLRLFYVNRLASLMEFHRGPAAFKMAMFALLALLVLIALARLVENARKGRRSEALWLAAAFLYIGIYSVLFGQSRFARVDAVRYVLILIPILGVVVGAATAWLVERFRILGWIPLVVLVALQAKELPNRPPERARTAAFLPKAAKLGDFLRQKGIKSVYTDYQVRGANHGLNFLLNEEFVFSSVTRERYRPYARQMEQAENPAVLNNLMGFSNFLRLTGAACETADVEGIHVQYNVRPPSDQWRILEDIGQATPWEGDPAQSDRTNHWSDFHALPASAGQVVYALDSAAPFTLCGMRLQCEPEGYPAAIRVDAWDSLANGWTNVVSDIPVTRYFWSGRRFYWGGPAFRLDCHFAPVRTTGVRVSMKAPRNGAVGVRRLLMMTPAEQKTPEAEDLDRLAAFIRSNGIRRVYSDRWEANGLAPRTGGEVKLSLVPKLYNHDALSQDLELDEATLIIKRGQDNYTDGLTDFENDRSIPFSVTNVGPWLVFQFGPDLPPHARKPYLEWAGVESRAVENARWSLLALQTLEEAMARKQEKRWMNLAGTAYSILPDHRPLMDARAATLEANGFLKDAARLREKAKVAWIPELALNARYHNGIHLLGLKLHTGPEDQVKERLGRDVDFNVRWLWRIPPKTPDGFRVRLSFKREGLVLYQDDYALPDNTVGYRPDDVIVVGRDLKLPLTIKPGLVQVEVALYNPGAEGGRVKFKSDTVKSGKTLVLPYPSLIE